MYSTGALNSRSKPKHSLKPHIFISHNWKRITSWLPQRSSAATKAKQSSVKNFIPGWCNWSIHPQPSRLQLYYRHPHNRCYICESKTLLLLKSPDDTWLHLAYSTGTPIRFDTKHYIIFARRVINRTSCQLQQAFLLAHLVPDSLP
jgi:hypothetical protein